MADTERKIDFFTKVPDLVGTVSCFIEYGFQKLNQFADDHSNGKILGILQKDV